MSLPERPLFPKAWKHYNTVVAIIGAILILLNTIIEATVFPETWNVWVSFAISLLVAILVWLNERRRKLGLNGDGYLAQVQAVIDDENGKHRKENKPTEDLIERTYPDDSK